MNKSIHVVTGAFGFSGRYLARELLARGCEVATLTNSPHRPHEFGARIAVHPLAFDDADQLAASLAGTRVLYNTYWVRFDHRDFNHTTAVDNTARLFAAARRAGVERIVHVSITHPNADSPLPYFAGKARLESLLDESGIPYSILRPAVLFGPEDILINNIAWALRRFPLFGIFGNGQYGLRPIHVEDFARLLADHGEKTSNEIVDAVGPESFTFREMVATIGRTIGHPRRLLSVPPWLGLAVAKAVGLWQRDVFLTREEIIGLMAGHLESDGPSTGSILLSQWAREHADTLGRHYASELRRRRDRQTAYT